MLARSFLFTTSLLCLTLPAHATLYKCADQHGNITYTNAKGSATGCKVLAEESVSTISSPVRRSGGSSSTPKASQTPTPSSFPSITPATQGARDGGRRTILEHELSVEETKCAKAREVLATPADAEKQKAAQNDLSLCGRNIEALKREISRL